MKSVWVILLLLMTWGVSAQSAGKAKVQKATFTVQGNCGMCEERIEKAAKANGGVLIADWKKETELLTVMYDPAKITLDQVHQQIAAVGHDTDKVRADDKVYESMHACCQYERAKVEKKEKK